MRVARDDLLATLPPEWPADLFPTIQARVRQSGVRVAVLDDDPTGTQTVHGVPVLTEWSTGSLAQVLAEPEPVFYILTNSRSMPAAQARTLNLDIARHLLAASRATGRRFVVVSRSDSTLRGHYPHEIEALAEGLGQPCDGTLIVPFFLEGGRYTINDIHYVAEGDWLVPAAESEFARDATFGYQSSNLRQWVSEKHGGRISAEEVAAVSLDDLRRGGPAAVAARLAGLRQGQVCVVNAASYRDLEVLVAGLLEAEAAGRRLIYRTAASFVRVRGAVTPRGPLTATDLAVAPCARGGLIVVGSYVQRTSDQLAAARALPGMVSVEAAVERLLRPAQRRAEVRRVAAMADHALAAGHDVAVYTSRRLVTGRDRQASLGIGQTISRALVAVVESLQAPPAWLIAKGGITSSDVATEGLGVRRAEVLGQAIPGVPIWRTGPESRWPGLVYVVFPGNVGGPQALAEMVGILRQAVPGAHGQSDPSPLAPGRG